MFGFLVVFVAALYVNCVSSLDVVAAIGASPLDVASAVRYIMRRKPIRDHKKGSRRKSLATSRRLEPNGLPRKEVLMRVVLHIPNIADDICLDVGANLTQLQIQDRALHERRWDDAIGRFVELDSPLTNAAGQQLFSVPVRATTPNGSIIHGVYLQVSHIDGELPARQLLQPVNRDGSPVEVVMSTSGRGSITITADTVEPVADTNTPRHAVVAHE